jgi:hypothetical protein
MATSETEAGVDVLSTHPNKQTELRYRISVDDSGTRATLASIVVKRASGATDGASLAISTDAVGGELAQRLVIDDQGNVGIGTGNPGARLDVVGDAKFSGPLSIQGALTVGGAATIGGDLTVTGKLTAASFQGNGAGLSNVTPKDDSITNAKLAQDAASLSKVSGGKMVVQGDSVAIGGGLEVKGAVKFQGSGSTTPGSTNWQPYPGNTGIYLDVDTSAGKFTTTPKYFTSLGGDSSHWATTGVTSIYTPSPTGFRVYVRWSDGSALTPAQANSLQWHVSWLGVEA